ncbi:LamG-like jellyroll fold domain-containing protein [Streptomyces niveus]
MSDGMGRRARRKWCALLAASVITTALPAASAAAHTRPPATAQAAQQAEAVSAEARAAAQAATTGERAEVLTERSEISQVFANPDGTFTQETNASPVRAEQDDGSWAPIDTTLERGGDGRIRARSTTTRVEFSGGGTQSMVSLTKDTKRLALGWPKALPAPAIEGSSATYPNVLTDVDLRLTATSTGFTQVLIVKTAEAAADPALERLHLSLDTSGVQALPGRDGGLRFIDSNGAKVFEGPGASMWDSAGDQQPPRTTGGARSATTDAPEPDDGGPKDPAAAPSAGDATAGVPITISDDRLILAPDLDLLRGADTVFPVYIDPPTAGLTRTDWTALSSDGDKFWEWSGDKGVGYCKDYGGYLCSTNAYTQRLYYEYPLTKLHGKKILDATFEAYQTWTFTCTPRWYNLSLVDRGISSSTTWSSKPVGTDLMGDRNVAYGRGSLCSPSQPANWVRFSDNTGEETNENLTTTLQSHASGKKPQITFSLTANDESSTASWARFRNDAKLSVTYVSIPQTPKPHGVRQGTTGLACNSAAIPFATSDTTPKMVATVQSADGSNAQVRALFEVWKADGSARVWYGFSPSGSGNWATDNATQTADTTALSAQTVYRMRVQTEAYYKTDRGVTGVLDSPWSSWCYFRVDTDSPPPPEISSADGLYKPAATDPASGGVGVSGQFTFTPGDAKPSTPALDSDVVSYRWRLNSGPVSNPIPVTQGASWSGPIKPDQAGENTIQVWGYDAASHSSLTGYYSFNVKGAEAPTGNWHLDNNGTDSTPATPHPLTPAGSATFTTQARSGSHALALNGTSAYAATGTAVLDTSKSFTVSAWARLTDNSRNFTVLSQAGTTASGFQLYYSKSFDTWVFNRHGSDISGSVITRSTALKPPVLSAWTHLSGTYDAAAQTIQLYVNGRPQGEPVPFTTPWKASGPLQVGRLHASAAYSEYFKGTIDDVRVWSRSTADSEIAQDARLEDEDTSDGTAGDPVVAPAGHWDATSATGSSITDASGYARSMTLNSAVLGPDPADAENAELGLPVRQVMELNGTTAHATVPGPVVDESGSFTVTTWARLDGNKLADTAKSYTVQVAGQSGTSQSSWGIWYEQPAGSSAGKWKFGRPSKDATGPAWTAAQSAVAEKNTWVRLTAVYDAQQETVDDGGQSHIGALYLYVDTAQMDGETGVSFNAPWQGTGQLTLGRALVNGSPTRYFPGHVADLRIWAGAMGPGTIGDLYNAEQ